MTEKKQSLKKPLRQPNTKEEQNVLQHLLFFIKGLIMGFCDVVPGVSGGTMALIMGIYERFICAVRGIMGFPKAVIRYLVLSTYSLTKKRKKRIKHTVFWDELKVSFAKIDVWFLIFLVAGIATALLVGSTFIVQALDHFFIPTMMFFIGLILASGHHLYRRIEKHTTRCWIVGIVFFLLGLSLVFLQPQTITLNVWWYFIIVGFFASGAMILPGISGSFMLLVFGVYEFFLYALHHPIQHFSAIALFLVGVLFGFTLISKFIVKQLKERPSQTLFALTGLVFGAIAVPIRDVIAQPVVWTTTTWIVSLGFFVAGFIVVLLIDYFGHKTKK